MPQEPKPKSKLQVLHESLVADQYDVPVKYEDFERNLQDEQKLKVLHQSLAKDEYDVPVRYDDFARNLELGSFSKKKDNTGLTSTSPGSEASLPTGQTTSPEVDKPNIPAPTPESLKAMAAKFNGKVTGPQTPEEKREEEQFRKQMPNAEYKADLSKLPQDVQAESFVRDIYKEQNPEQFREQDPFATFGKSAWNVLAYQLPSALAATAAVLTPDQPLVQSPITFDDKQRKKYKEQADASKVAMLEWASQHQAKGQEVSKDLVNTLDKVEDPVDFMNWMSAAAGQTVAQVPLSVATGGASSIGQEIGSIYLEGVDQVAREKGISIKEVIDQKLDDPAFALAYGSAAGLLDRIGAGKIMKTFGKDAIKKSLRTRAVGIIESGATEGATEYSQTFLEQLGGSQVGGKDFSEAWAEAQTSQAAKERLEALAQGIAGGGVMSGVGSMTGGAPNEVNVNAPEGVLGAVDSPAVVEANQQPDIPEPPAPANNPVTIADPNTIAENKEIVQPTEPTEVVQPAPEPAVADEATPQIPEKQVPTNIPVDTPEEQAARQAEVIAEYERANNMKKTAVTAKEAIIAENLKRFPKESFYRHGDRNISKDERAIRMMYFGKKEKPDTIPIDVQAGIMSKIINPEGDGTEISEQDIVDFVMKFPHGKKQFIKFTQQDAEIVAENIIDENPEISTNKNLLYALETIDKEGLTENNLQSPEVQELLSNTFMFDDADRENIKLIFEYGKTEEGRKTIAKLRDVINQSVDEGTGEGTVISKVQGEQTPTTSKQEIQLNESDYPADWDIGGQTTKKKKKANIASTEKKIARLNKKIKKGTADPGTVTKQKNLTSKLERLKMKRYDGEQASTDKFYEPPIGAPTRKGKVARISVSPVYGGKPKLLKDIMLDLSKSIPNTIYYTKSPIKKRRSIGSYNPTNAAVAIKYKGDLDVTAHELGHALDDRYGILEAIPSTNTKSIHAELKELSEYGSKPPKGHPDPNKYRRGEGMAEFIRAYLVNPDQTVKQYPDTAAWFLQAVPAETIATINKFGNDIRSFAGLSSHDQIMSNLQFEPEKKLGGLASFFKPTSAQKENFRITWVDRIGQKITNDKLYFEKSVRFLEQAQGVQLTPEKNPSMLARVLMGANEKMDNVFEKGLVNIKNQYVRDEVTNAHMNFEWLLQPFENSTVASIKQEQQEAITYMIAERTVELANRFNREDILSGIGAGLFKDTTVAMNRLNDFKNETPEKQARILEAVRRYREYADRVLKYMVGKGRLSDEQYNMIKADNTQYVAMQRVLEAAPGEEIVVYSGTGGGVSIGSVKSVIKKIKGSSALIKNPYESLIETTIKSIREADRNEVMQAFRELFTYDRRMYKGDPKYTAQIARPATSKDKNTVQIFVAGKSEYWQLDDDVYASVKNIMETSSTLPLVLTALPKMLRWSVTNFPVFAIRNRIRDIQQRMIVSNTKSFRGYDIYKDKKTKELTRNSFQLFGGGQAGYYVINDDFYYKKLSQTVEALSKDKKTILTNPKLLFQKASSGYDALLSAGERATRLEEYRSAFKFAKDKGLDDYNASIYAAYKSRDLLDFSVAGEWLRVMNQIVPFSNAAVQGLRKTVNSVRENPGGFATRFALYAVVPALLNRILVSMWEKDEEYSNMPNYRRDLFYNIPLGPDLWLTIPRPFEIGVIASGVERFMSKYFFQEENALDGYAKSLATSIMPVDDAALAGGYKPFIEVIANYDFFRDTSIIPPDQVGLALENRDTSKASRLGQALQSVVGVDARQMDYLVKSTTSYFGEFAIKVSDIGKEESRYQFNWASTGLLKGDPLYDSKDVQWVMEFVKENGIHWSDPYYQELNMIISTYYQAVDAKDREEIGDTAREFARMLKKEFQTNEHYQRENQVLEE